MIKNREEAPKYGAFYKENIGKMPGGFGLIAWDSFNCLSPIQTVIWLKICETAYKTVASNIINVGESWLNRNFKDRSEWKLVINTILELEDIGFIKCTMYKSSIVVNIDFDNLPNVIKAIGRERGAGMRIIETSTHVLSLNQNQLSAAARPLEYTERGCDVLKNIIDEICG